MDASPNAELYQALGGDETIAYIKAQRQPYRFEILSLPYGGHADGRDSDGQYFDETTDFLDGAIPNLPVIFPPHGTLNGFDTTVVGRELSRRYDSYGGWSFVELDPNSDHFDNLVKAHQAKKLGGSTAVLPSGYKANEDTGHIEVWLPGELSLVDMLNYSNFKPVNRLAMAKAEVEIVMEDYYGDPVFEQDPSIREEILNMLNKLRELFSIKRAVDNENPGFASVSINDAIVESEIEVMAKCATCPDGLAEEAAILKAELETMKAEEAEVVKCATCPKALQWVKAAAISGMLEIDEAFPLLEKFQTNEGVAEWPVIKAQVESRTVVPVAEPDQPLVNFAKAAATKTPADYALLTNLNKDTTNTVDNDYMNRVRKYVGMETK